MSDDWLRTSVGTSDADSITVMGRNVADELMGQVTLTQLAFLLVRKRMPSEGETRLLDAVLVSLADHGLTPTVLAARLTYTGAPESLQGAIAAGLLGSGSVFLGVVEDTARFLEGILESEPPDLRAAAEAALEGHKGRVPGLGHPIHKVQDPRTPKLYAIAEETGTLGPHLQLLREIADVYGRGLPINGAGVAGAALADLGFRPQLLRGFSLLARTAGLLGHLREEHERPIGFRLAALAEAGIEYDG
jgi:citrate synthase